MTAFGAGRRVRAIQWPVTSDIGTQLSCADALCGRLRGVHRAGAPAAALASERTKAPSRRRKGAEGLPIRPLDLAQTQNAPVSPLQRYGPIAGRGVTEYPRGAGPAFFLKQPSFRETWSPCECGRLNDDIQAIPHDIWRNYS
jgi:hypothetical protein